MFIAFAAVLTLAAAQDAAAQPAQPVMTEEEREAAAEEARRNEVVCRRERFVGSNRTTRVCLTRAEWDRARDVAIENQRRVGEGPRERVGRGADEG